MPIKLVAEAEAALGFQRYDSPPELQGVRYRPLSKRRALGGWFMEYLRLENGRPQDMDQGLDQGLGQDGETPFEARQLSFSRAEAGRINAFHIHPKAPQDELWTVVDGRLLVWLADLRDGSPTVGQRRSYLLDGEAPALLYIPSGVAHGYRAGPAGALLIYAMNAQFDPSDPNEGRLPWDHFGAALWEDDRG